MAAAEESDQNELTLDLESLLEASRTPEGRSRLSSSASTIIPATLRHLSLPSLRLLRNLCAGEIASQDAFLASGGADTVTDLLLSPEVSVEVLRAGVQLLGNVALAGEPHRDAVWKRLFPDGLLRLARVGERGVSDPLCMVMDTCCSEVGGKERLEKLCGTDSGLRILVELVRTGFKSGYQEEWLEWLLFKVCVEEQRFSTLFSALNSSDNTSIASEFKSEPFNAQHAFLLGVLSKCLTERPKEVTVSDKFALEIFKLLKMTYNIVDFTTRLDSSVPSGRPVIDLLGYSLLILRDICAWENTSFSSDIDQNCLVNLLLNAGLLDFVLSLLGELEPPAIVRKSMVNNTDGSSPIEMTKKVCPYKGYRRDVVSVIGNLLHRRKRVQDEVREREAILLLLQQCVVDQENPYLREWGLMAVRNMLEGNEVNQREVAELEMRESVTPPEISRLGLKVEVDEATKRAKLVNISG